MMLADQGRNLGLNHVILPVHIASIRLAQTDAAAMIRAVFQTPIATHPRPLTDTATFGTFCCEGRCEVRFAAPIERLNAKRASFPYFAEVADDDANLRQTSVPQRWNLIRQDMPLARR